MTSGHGESPPPSPPLGRAALASPERLTANRLLRRLPAEHRDRLAGAGAVVLAPAGAVLYEPEALISEVYFPLSAVVSLLVVFTGGAVIEAAAVGNAGMVGLPVALGGDSDSHRALVRSGGALFCLPAEHFRRALTVDAPLQTTVLRFTQLLLAQLARAGACAAVHSVAERCARWLLTTSDALGSDQFPLTHRTMATMLGVRRASVTVAAGALQAAGVITYRHGHVRILDRAGLAAAACPCYRALTSLDARLLDG